MKYYGCTGVVTVIEREINELSSNFILVYCVNVYSNNIGKCMNIYLLPPSMG